MTTTTELKLGDHVRDSVTGLEGTVTVIADYLHGTRRAMVETMTDPGRGITEEWLAVDRLVVIA